MWTRDVPKVDGYYWAKECVNERRNEYGYTQIVLLHRTYGITFVSFMGNEENGNPRAYLWYDDAMFFVPPAFTTHDAIRLGVTA